MKQKFNFPLSALAAAILSVSLVGCGDSGGSTITVPTDENRANEADSKLDSAAASNVNTVPSVQVTGKAVDGYLSGATVCLDLNRDFVCAPDEPATTTLNDGRYLLDLPSTLTAAQRNAAQVVVQGGIDQDTGAEFTGKMSAPLRGDAQGLTNVTPFTTLLAQVVTDNSALSDSDKAKVSGWLEGVASADVTGDPKTKNALLIEAVALQKTLDMLVAGSSKNQGETLAELITALGNTTAPATASAGRTTAAATVSRLAQAVDSVSSVPDAVKTAAKSVASAVRETGAANSSADLTAALAAVSKKAEEAINTVKQASDKSAVVVAPVVAATTEEINNAKIERVLGLAGYEVQSEGETADPVVTALQGFSGLTGTTTLEELQAWVSSASFDGKEALLQAIDNALLMAKANPIVPVDMRAVIDKGGFVEYDVAEGIWSYGFPTLGTWGLSASAGQLTGEIPFEGKGLNPVSGQFDQPYIGRDSADEFFYTGGAWYPMTSERYRVEDGVMYIDASNTEQGKSVTWRQARLVAIEDLSGQSKALNVWDSTKNYTMTFPQGSQRYLIKVTGSSEAALTAFPYDSSRVGTFTDQPYNVTHFTSWADFEANCLGKTLSCSLATSSGDTYLTTGAANSDGTYPIIDQGFNGTVYGDPSDNSSYQRTVGVLVPKTTADGMTYWRMDIDASLMKNPDDYDSDLEKPALLLHPSFDKEGNPAGNIISEGYVSSNNDTEDFVAYSRNTEAAVAARFASEFDKLDVDITYDASACQGVSGSMRLDIEAYSGGFDGSSWRSVAGLFGVSATAAKGTAYSLKEVGSFVDNPENMRLSLYTPDSEGSTYTSIYSYSPDFAADSPIVMSKVSEGHYQLKGALTNPSCLDMETYPPAEEPGL